MTDETNETEANDAAAGRAEFALLCADQMLAILVMDFGYMNEPTYGHTPLRHQLAWKMCADALGDEMSNKVREMSEQAIKEAPTVRDAMAAGIAAQIEVGGSGQPYD